MPHNLAVTFYLYLRQYTITGAASCLSMTSSPKVLPLSLSV
jgi:hypothetical protein